ncbi:MAG TPA: ShlB/FhaC/HecB family hemolysin secretion/activation protein [Gemmatimonadales bacterium]|nr:ShlB/FhaC/HecB family hemolysin secretion/activation protein [Gemmatimonadales bacterium]
MVESLLAILLLAQPLSNTDTTQPFADSTTRALVERAIARRGNSDADISECGVPIVSDRFHCPRAPHPLAADGPEWYRYRLIDSLTVARAGGHPVRVYEVEATPRRPAPALVAGCLWIEADSYAVVRLALRDVGSELLAQALPGRLVDSLPPDITGERAQGVSFEKPSDPVRYDRVQGWSFGFGYRLRVPAIEFAGVQGTIRYGISDERLTGRLSFLRDAPTGRIAISGYRDVVDVDPISPGQTVGNTLDAIFAAHDNGDYMLATGGSASYGFTLPIGWELGFSARVERQRSVIREASSDVNDFFGGDGLFPDNPPVTEGTFLGGALTVSGAIGPRWTVTVDALGGEGLFTGRVFGQIRHSLGGRRGITIRGKAGIATSTDLDQMQFRVGGMNTVRGFDYGSQRGQAFWAAQLDVAPIRGRIRPVLFADAGRAADPSDLFEGDVLVGAGVGVSIFGGLLRLDLSRRLSPGNGTLRFDVTAGAPR